MYTVVYLLENTSLRGWWWGKINVKQAKGGCEK
jgi:hypothetical protein